MPEIDSEIRRCLQSDEMRHDKRISLVSLRTGNFWPPDNLLPLTGQAQHYGIPTRLLDWSRDPLVSMYFAVEGAIKEEDKKKNHSSSEDNKIAVWVFDYDNFVLQSLKLHESENHLKLVTAPASTNVNLRAQQGVFTLWRPPTINEGRKAIDTVSLDCTINKIFGNDSGTYFFHKFTLPYSKLKELREKLRRVGVNTVKYFPDFRGASETVMQDLKEND